MFNKVLVPMNLSDSFVQNINESWFPSKLGVQHFHLLHVLSSGLADKKHAENILEERVSMILTGTNSSASYEVAQGHIGTEIVNKAKEGYYDLIMIPANNKSVLVRIMLGSTTTEVIRMTDTPVLIYKPTSPSLNTVLYATDFGEAAERALGYVGFIGKIGSELIIQHVGRRAADPLAEFNRKEIASQKLEQIKEELEAYWSDMSMVSSMGTPSGVIALSAEQNEVDLIILGKANTAVMKKILGSTAEKVANAVKSSLLLVP